MMCKNQHLPGTLAILLFFSGCTSFQVEEAGRSLTLGLIEGIVDAAIGEIPYEKSAHQQYLDDLAEREEEARARDEREKRHYEKKAKAMMDAIERTERQTGQLQLEATTMDFERREEERLSGRVETFEQQAEFDKLMRELEIAEGQNDDAPLDASLVLERVKPL